MGKGPSKAALILYEARMRAEAAKEAVRLARQNLTIAEAAASAHVAAYEALEKALTPKPRKKAATASPAQPKLPTDKKEKEPAKVEGGNGGADLEPEDFGPRCGVCGHGEQYQDHFQPSPNYHTFDAPAPVVAKKSKRKEAHTLSVPNSEIEKASAMSAGAD